MLSLVALFVFLIVVAGKTLAYEGTADISGTGLSCKATSVWHETRYHVVGRCDGLVYPYQTQYGYYSIWAHDATRDTYTRVDDIDRGYFEGDVTNAFDKMIITAEQDGGPRRPSAYVVASGTVEKFAFDKSKVTAPAEDTKVTTGTTNKTTTVQNSTASKTATTSSATGSVVGRIVTSLLVIILVIVGVVIAGSLLFRSRGSVSA